MVITPFEIIKEQVSPKTIRALAQIEDDELLKTFFAFFICESASNIKLPSKKHKLAIAKELIKRGANYQDLAKILNLNIRTLKGIKNDTRADN